MEERSLGGIGGSDWDYTKSLALVRSARCYPFEDRGRKTAKPSAIEAVDFHLADTAEQRTAAVTWGAESD